MGVVGRQNQPKRTRVYMGTGHWGKDLPSQILGGGARGGGAGRKKKGKSGDIHWIQLASVFARERNKSASQVRKNTQRTKVYTTRTEQRQTPSRTGSPQTRWGGKKRKKMVKKIVDTRQAERTDGRKLRRRVKPELGTEANLKKK